MTQTPITPAVGSAAPPAAPLRPPYVKVFLTFARNSLVRDMTFRTNFVIETISAISWTLMNLGFYDLIFQFTSSIGRDTGWGKYQFFVFFATTMIVNSLVESFFMNNAEEFSELIRTGNLDFALLKPIDTQFLISLQKVDYSSLFNVVIGLGLLGYSVLRLHFGAEHLVISPLQFVLYPVYVLCGVAILYSLMIAMAASSVWLGRNQSLQQFWFYITIFSRYPMEIYSGPEGALRNFSGRALRGFFTFIIPVLVAINVPARLMAKPLSDQGWYLVLFALPATALSLWASRLVFRLALSAYRSASS